MKLVRTTRTYEAVTLPDEKREGETLTIGGVPIPVADAHAKKYEQTAAEVGVALTVTDAPDDGDGDAPTAREVDGVTPDLSAGVAVITGRGDPVPFNPTPSGDTAGDTQEA